MFPLRVASRKTGSSPTRTMKSCCIAEKTMLVRRSCGRNQDVFRSKNGRGTEGRADIRCDTFLRPTNKIIGGILFSSRGPRHSPRLLSNCFVGCCGGRTFVNDGAAAAKSLDCLLKPCRRAESRDQVDRTSRNLTITIRTRSQCKLLFLKPSADNACREEHSRRRSNTLGADE